MIFWKSWKDDPYWQKMDRIDRAFFLFKITTAILGFLALGLGFIYTLSLILGTSITWNDDFLKVSWWVIFPMMWLYNIVEFCYFNFYKKEPVSLACILSLFLFTLLAGFYGGIYLWKISTP